MIAVSDEAERSIVITRTIDGPRDLVFEMYADVKHLTNWWGPDGFTTTTHRFEFRPGGVWGFVMHGPDGVDYPEWIEYREIVRPERIVLEHGERAGDPNAFISTITFDTRGAVTEVTMRAVFKTKALRDEAIERFGAIEGGQQTLGRLAGYVATQLVSE